jgi:hypothetical protein
MDDTTDKLPSQRSTASEASTHGAVAVASAQSQPQGSPTLLSHNATVDSPLVAEKASVVPHHAFVQPSTAPDNTSNKSHEAVTTKERLAVRLADQSDDDRSFQLIRSPSIRSPSISFEDSEKSPPQAYPCKLGQSADDAELDEGLFNEASDSRATKSTPKTPPSPPSSSDDDSIDATPSFLGQETNEDHSILTVRIESRLL